MTDYLLFIDTETSGLPKDWQKPYYAEDNWPYCVQVAWIIYTKNRQEIKRENHFVNEDNFIISKSALKVHHITHAFLAANGKRRSYVLDLLKKDIEKYEPLIIGHFMEFDYKMLAVDFYRTGIDNPVKIENTFCTMLATTSMVKNPVMKFFRLGQLYEELFQAELHDQHNAIVDAQATFECFFELLRRGDVSDKIIESQQATLTKKEPEQVGKGCLIPTFLIIFLSLILIYFL